MALSLSSTGLTADSLVRELGGAGRGTNPL